MNQQTQSPELAQDARLFLQKDFGECFSQLRHHDSRIIDIMKFLFTGYTAVAAIALGLYEYKSADPPIDLTLAAIGVLSVGTVAGIVMYVLALRNRVYFVRVTRYINECRRLFLSARPLGFKNVTGMYVDPSQPSYLNWRSNQAWLCFLVAALNSFLLGLTLYIWQQQEEWIAAYCVIAFILTTAIQLLLGIRYLRGHDQRAEAARSSLEQV